MVIKRGKILNYGDNVDYFIASYKRKIIILKAFVSITNIIFPTIALLLIVISTLNIAGGNYLTPINGADYIIFAALISGIIALINSLISFFLLKEKIIFYNEIYYKLVIEKQRYKLNEDKYLPFENKEKKFENELFIIITGYNKEEKEN